MAKRRSKKHEAGIRDIQMPLSFAQAEAWTPPVVSALPRWPKGGRVSVDAETRDPDLRKLGPGPRRGGYVVGYSFAIENGPSFYVPLRHGSGDNVENPAAAVQYLRDQAAAFNGELVGANLQYDLDFFGEMGVEFPKVQWFRDIQVADPLINEHHLSYGLNAIAERWGFEGKDEAQLKEAAVEWGIDPKNEMWKLPARYVAEYARMDAVLPLLILRKQEAEIESQELWDIFNLESKVLPVLLTMRRRGVRIDTDRLDQVEAFATKNGNAALERVYEETGRRLKLDDVMKARAIAPIFNEIGVDLDETSLGQPNIDKEVIDRIDHPAARDIGQARRLYKLRNTFVKSIRNHMTNGRLHCSFNQMKGTSSGEGVPKDEKGARYGRLSSSNPNLQQQPGRDHPYDVKTGIAFSKLWRSIYVPDEGGLWVAADYSQQEPRVLTHYAELCNCQMAREFGDRYRNDPNADTYTGLSEMTGTPRKAAKVIYLGLSYSMGPPKLCRTLGLPTEWRPDKDGKLREFAGPEGEALFKAFHAGVPFVRQLDYMIRDRIQEAGYIRTAGGRKIRFPEKSQPTRNPFTGRMEKYDWAQKGLNRLIQGSSADQTKMAVVMLHEAGKYLQLQVHDEIDGTAKDEADAREYGTIMREALKLRVPMRVDVEIGSSWGDSME